MKSFLLSDSKARLLKRLCEESDNAQHRLGAVLYKGGAIISIGVNKSGSSKLTKRHRYLRPFAQSVHAEVNAILGITKEEASKCTLIVGRITAAGRFAMAKPCAMCYAILKQMRVRKVFYTTGEYIGDSPVVEQLTEENKNDKPGVCYHDHI